MGQRTETGHQQVLDYMDLHLGSGETYSIFGDAINSLLAQRSSAIKTFDVHSEDKTNGEQEAQTFAVSLVEAVAYARHDTAFLKSLREAQVKEAANEEQLLVTGYIQKSGIDLNERRIPSDLLLSSRQTLITAAVDQLRTLMEANDNLKKDLSNEQNNVQTIELGITALIALDQHDYQTFDLIARQLEITSAPKLEKDPSAQPAPIITAAQDLIADAFHSRHISPTLEEHPEVTLAIKQSKPEPPTKPRARRDNTDSWKAMGLVDASEIQGYRNALNGLAEKSDTFLSPTTEPKQLIKDLKKIDRDALFILLQDVYKHGLAYKSIARILALLDWQEGQKIEPWQTYAEHAKLIQLDKVRTLLPEKPAQAPPKEVVFESSRQPEVHANRFPQTEAEIEIFIRNTLDEFESLIHQKGKSAVWPMNPGQFSNVVENISKRCVDENKDIVGYEESDNKPYFSKLAFIKLLALEKYQRINAHALSRAFKRFDAIFVAKFQNS